MEKDIVLKNYFGKEKRKSIKGSLITLGGIAVFLSPTLAVLADVAKETYFNESINDDNMLIETIGYEQLKKCYFVQIRNNNSGMDEFYICSRTISMIDRNYKYINIFDKKTVFECNYSLDISQIINNKIMEKEISIGDYLYEYDNIKTEYTTEEVENLLEQIKEDIKEEKKALVKASFNANDVTKVNV